MKFRLPIQLSDSEKSAISSKLPRITWPAAANAARAINAKLPKVTLGPADKKEEIFTAEELAETMSLYERKK